MGAWSGSLVPLVVLIVLIYCSRFLSHEVKVSLSSFFFYLSDISMWITYSNEGCDYVFVVIKVTSLCCLLLPPVSSKAVKLGGSSRIQAADTAASFMTGTFPNPSVAACEPAETF